MNIGALRHPVVFQEPGASVSDGDGGYTQAVTVLVPLWWMAIQPATARDLERVVAGTVMSTATHIAKGRFHASVSTTTQMKWTDRLGQAHLASVVGVSNVDERCVDMVLACVEVVP